MNNEIFEVKGNAPVRFLTVLVGLALWFGTRSEGFAQSDSYINISVIGPGSTMIIGGYGYQYDVYVVPVMSANVIQVCAETGSWDFDCTGQNPVAYVGAGADLGTAGYNAWVLYETNQNPADPTFGMAVSLSGGSQCVDGDFTPPNAGYYMITANMDTLNCYDYDWSTQMTVLAVELTDLSMYSFPPNSPDTATYCSSPLIYSWIVSPTPGDVATFQADLIPDDNTTEGLLSWSGATQCAGSPRQATVSGTTPAINNVKVSLGGSSLSAQGISVLVTLQSVGFPNSLLFLKATGYTDTGGVMTQCPQWTSGGLNDPISQAISTYINVTPTVVVSTGSSGIPFTLSSTASTDEAYNGAFSGTSSTSPQSLSSDSEAVPLPSTIGILTDSITWQFSIVGLTPRFTTSGPHTCYVTYGTPVAQPYSDFGSFGYAVTQNRLSRACLLASTLSDIPDIVAAVGIVDTSGSLFSYQYTVGTPPPDSGQTHVADPWEIVPPLVVPPGGSGAGTGGDCFTESYLMHYDLNLLGLNVSIPIKIFPVTASWDHISTGEKEKGSPSPPNPGFNPLVYGNPLNFFEGTVLIANSGQYSYWPGSLGSSYNTAQSVLSAVTASGSNQYFKLYTPPPYYPFPTNTYNGYPYGSVYLP